MSIKSRLLRYSYWVNDWLHGSPIRKEYNEIRKISKGGTEAIRLQKEKLLATLAYAVNNTEFYSKCDPTNLYSFPVVNKIILQVNHDKIAVPIENIPGQKGEVHIQSTSGSTGTPFRVRQDTIKRNRRIAELKYFGELVGFSSHEPLCQLRIWTKWQSKSRWQSFKENIYPFNIADMSDAHLEEMIHLINKKKIVSLRSYASSYKIIADFVKRRNLKVPSLKICIAGSESLEEDVRESVKNNLDCDIVSQYADEECGILAQESLKGKPMNFYLNHASYYFEVLKMDSDETAEYGELGRIVITDLTNRAFPMVRYDTGDVGILQVADKNSNGFPFISSLFGRRLDLVYDTSGKPIHPMVLSRVLKNFDHIIQWQFLQTDKTEYTLKLNINDNLDQEKIIKELKEYFGNDARIKIEYVDSIPVLKSGKRKAVMNVVPPPK